MKASSSIESAADSAPASMGAPIAGLSLQRWAGLAIFFAGVGVSIADAAHLAAAA